MAGDWINIELKMPRLKDPSDRREMAKFVASLVSKLEDVYTYAAGGSAIWDTNQDTGVQTEETPNEDIIRMDAAGAEVVQMNSSQFAVNSGLKLGLEGYDGDTYWKYNSVTGYLEGWVQGTKRKEL